MNFVWFLIFGLIVFLMSLICYESFRSTTLYALAIGGAVNANFFHAGNYPQRHGLHRRFRQDNCQS